MEFGNLRPYRHSGKFGIHALLLVPLVGALLGWPLGFGYAFLIKWIPIVYLNILITVGYGFIVGFAVAATVKFCRVRNVLVASLLATVVGLLANYFQWNGHMHALLDGAPPLCAPAGIWGVMQQLFEHGSWAMRDGDNVTGWFLVAVWVVEAAAILVLTVLVGMCTIRDTPYCEKSGCWLDEETKYDTLAAFTDAQQLAALRNGDVSPVIEAKPREAGAPTFARLTLKHSPECEEFFTLLVSNVTLTTDKKGNVEEKATALTKDLVLPREMRELVERFAELKPAGGAAGAGSGEPEAAAQPPVSGA
jgi:hypothetical protein